MNDGWRTGIPASRSSTAASSATDVRALARRRWCRHPGVLTAVVRNRTNREGGGAIFFVSNDGSGEVGISDSIIRDNTGDGFSTHPSILFLGRRTSLTDSVVK